MSPRTHAMLLLAFVCATQALSAQETPKAPAELGQLSSFLGTWQCNGQIFARDSRPRHATAAVGHATTAVGGHWMQFAYEERQTTANPAPYSVAGYMGYDASTKRLVQTIVDNYGNYSPAFSDGWNGDTLLFEGSTRAADGKRMLVRDYFVRKGNNDFVHFSESQAPGDQWLKPDEETCHVETR